MKRLLLFQETDNKLVVSAKTPVTIPEKLAERAATETISEMGARKTRSGKCLLV